MLTELVTFCQDMVEIVCLDTTDQTELSLKLKKLDQLPAAKSRIFVMTPTVAAKVTKHTDKLQCHSVILDKTDLL